MRVLIVPFLQRIYAKESLAPTVYALRLQSHPGFRKAITTPHDAKQFRDRFISVYLSSYEPYCGNAPSLTGSRS